MTRLRRGLCLWGVLAGLGLGCDPEGDGASSGDDVSETDPAVPAPTCSDWCGLMADHCPEEAVLPRDACVEFCEHPQVVMFPPGAPGESDTNTLACRVYHAERAADLEGSERLEACANAHASGGDACGDWCEVYCYQAEQVCTSNNPDYVGPPLYEDTEACQQACADFPTDVLDGISQTEQQFGYGDTVQCRLHHMQADVGHAADGDSRFDLHCPHADAESTPDTCSDEAPPNIPNYCGYAVTFCIGDNALFPEGTDIAGCAGTLAPLVGDQGQPYQELGFSSFTDPDLRTLGCLNYWITLAPIDPDLYCARGDWDPEGPGVCKGEVP